MVANVEKKVIVKSKEEIPDYLIREVIYGKPYYYKDYKSVLNQEKTLEDIMGSSRLQSFIVSILALYLANILENKYWVLSSEPGLHLNKNDNLSMDIALYEKSKFPIEKIDTHYFEEIPEFVIEVDVNIDLTNPQNQDYVFQKTQRLLDFGTSEVVWILTKSRKIMVAKPNEPWIVDNWDKAITVLEHSFVLEDLLREKGMIA